MLWTWIRSPCTDTYGFPATDLGSNRNWRSLLDLEPIFNIAGTNTVGSPMRHNTRSGRPAWLKRSWGPRDGTAREEVFLLVVPVGVGCSRDSWVRRTD